MRLNKVKKTRYTKVFRNLREGQYLICFGSRIKLANYDRQSNAFFIEDKNASWEANDDRITDIYHIDDDRICK